jgi:hypothetical protein
MIYYTGVYNRQDTKGQKIKARIGKTFLHEFHEGTRIREGGTANIQPSTPNSGLGQLQGRQKFLTAKYTKGDGKFSHKEHREKGLCGKTGL